MHPAPTYTACGAAKGALNNHLADVQAMAFTFCCSTEEASETDHHLSACAGHKHNGEMCLARWIDGSVIPYAIDADSFPTRSDAHLVGYALGVAAADWNSKDISVEFKHADEGERPVFTVEYAHGSHPPKGDITYAIAFFPCQERRLTLRVFRAALQTRQPHSFLPKILRHELGHILGLRHDDAKLTEPGRPSVQLTSRKTSSVMRSAFGPEDKVTIRKSDVKAIQQLYTLPEGSEFGGFTVRSVDPTTAGQQNVAFRARRGNFSTLSTESSLVGDETMPTGAPSHNTTIAVCLAISVGALIMLALSPRMTIVSCCSA